MRDASTFGIVGLSLAPGAPAIDGRQVRDRRVRGCEIWIPCDESRTRNPELHGLWIVAVGAGDRMRVTGIVQLLAEILVRELVAFRETLGRIALPELAIERHHRGMAVQTRAGLRLREPLWWPPGRRACRRGRGGRGSRSRMRSRGTCASATGRARSSPPGRASLPPCPPKRVRVVCAVRRYDSYCFGQLTPHFAGSVVSSVTSINRT